MLLWVTVLKVSMTFAVGLNLCVVKLPGYGDITDDAIHLAAMTFSDQANVSLSVSIATLNPVSFSSIAEPDCSIFNMTCTGLITFADCSHAIFIDFWAEEHVIPHVMFTNRACDFVSSHGVKMIPHFTTQNKLISDIVVQEEWSDVVIMYDSLLENNQLADLLNRLSDSFVGTTVIDLSEARSISSTVTESIRGVSTVQYKNIVIVATDATVNELIKQAYQHKILGQKYFWIVVSDSLTFPTLTSMLRERSNVVIIRTDDAPGSWDECDKHVPLSCPLYNQSQVYLMEIHDAFHIIVHSTQQISHPDLLLNLGPGCSDGIVSEKDPQLVSGKRELVNIIRKTSFVGKTRHYKFDDAGYVTARSYNIVSTSDKRPKWFHNVGTWSEEGRLEVFDEEIFENTFRNFGNTTLLIGSQEALPFVVKNIIDNRTVFTGFCIDILDELALRFNFNYTIVEPSDRIWGAPINDKGDWNGIVGMIVRKELDFGAGPFTITSIRESVIDFTKPFMEDGAGIITRRPDGESQKMFKMFTPFAPIVWGCIVIAIIVVSVLLYLVNRYSPFAAHKVLPESGHAGSHAEMMSLKTTLWLIYGSYMEQGGDPHPNSTSGRCILGFWWLFTILMASTYTANLAAFLTVTIAEKPINSLAELAAQDEMQPLVKFGSNLYSLFKDADNGVYKDVWGKMRGYPVVKSNDEALRHVRDGTMAYMTDRSQLEYILLHDCEQYSLADEIFNTAGLGFVVPENSPFLEAFNYNIMKMQEAGLIDKWKQKWWPSSDKCSGSERTSSATILGLDSLAGPFLIYASVVGVALLCLIFELGLHVTKLNMLCQKIKQCQSSGTQDLSLHRTDSRT
ncbi:glutamate receptor-like [Haliotis rufescens]|uniref:glutamate receptor-like n=1 Tax=Haliotis rufescens TaxID=6454 RepID=UPI00201ECD9A|nr:glutamate receptor-like [Haliotis rufescens]